MLREQIKVLEQKRATQATKVCYNWFKRSYFGSLGTKISYFDLELINNKYCYVKATFPIPLKPKGKLIGRCSNDYTVSLQFGIPCRYKI